MRESSADRSEAFDVVIVGGGNAGISLASFLRRTAPKLSVAVVAPGGDHLYRPLLSYVGAGMCSPRRARRGQRRVMPTGVRWYPDVVTDVTPRGARGGSDTGHTVVTAEGVTLRATDLVLCPGSTVDWEAIPGSRRACVSEYASTNYLPDLAPKTWRLLHDLERGQAVFVTADRHTPCPGVGLKPVFLAADHWRSEGRLADIDITVVLEDESPVGLPLADECILAELDRLGARVHVGARVEAIDADARIVSFVTSDGRGRQQSYDAMHLTPPHRGHDWLVGAQMTDPVTTLVANDPTTLEHSRHPGIWALGDAATLDTPSSGGGLRHQVPVVGRNIVARRAGRPYRHYDGYTVAPIPLDRRRLLLAEWNRAGVEVRSFPPASLARPLRSLLWFDLFLQPPVYWLRLLRGTGLADS